MTAPPLRNGSRPARPVLIIDGASRGDIGVIRSLGLAGVPVHLLRADPRSPSAASRYVVASHDFPSSSASDEEKIGRLLEVAAGCPDRPLVMATGDSSLRLLSRHRTAIEPVLDHDMPAAHVVETCMDKDRFAEAAERLGLPVPRTIVPARRGDIETAASRLRFPVFVKPVSRESWARLPEGSVDNVKGQRANGPAELLALYDRLEGSDGARRIIVQEFVDGGDEEHMSVHAYVDRSGAPLGFFTARKQRLWPPHAGVGALVTSWPFPEPLLLARRVLDALEYTGFAILQFKRSPTTGSFELLEINCRYSTWTELPSRAGCNVPAAAYAAMTGGPPPRLEQRFGPSWLDLERDLVALRTYLRSGEWTLTQYARSLATVRCWAFFAWGDPGPFLRRVTPGAARG